MDFSGVVEPVIKLINSIEAPLLIIVSVIGVIYSIYLGVKLATASTKERRANARTHLITAVIAYFLIFVMIYLVKIYSPALIKWADGDSTALKSVSADLSAPLDQAKNLYDQSKEIVNNGEDGNIISDTVSDVIKSGNEFIGNEAEGLSNIDSKNVFVENTEE